MQWHAGCHADVGGGSHADDDLNHPNSLSNIPLRWMIKECFLHETGIEFDDESLSDLGLDRRALEAHTTHAGFDHNQPNESAAAFTTHKGPATSFPLRYAKDCLDAALSTAYDQLIQAPVWWLLEYVPMVDTSQQPDGSWLRLRRSVD